MSVPKQYGSFTNRRAFYLILLIALLVRIGGALFLGNEVSGLSGAHDEITYSMLGQRFATGHGMTFPTNWYPWIEADSPQSYFSYTMSLFLAGIYTVAGYQPVVARLVMAVLSTLVVLLIMLIARRLFDERISLISGAIAAVYAYLVFYGVTLVTETPFILAVAGAIYLAYRLTERPSPGLWLALGMVLSIAVLMRMAVIFFVPILLLWLVWELRGREKLILVKAALPLLLIVLTLLPFTIRNYRLWGHFMILESQFGHVFWNGNHPDHDGDFHPYQVFDIPGEVLASKNDAEITNTLLALGIENVLDDPGHFVRLTLTRLREFFTFWPTSDSPPLANLLRVLSFGLLAPLALVGLALNLRQWRSMAPILLFMLLHTGVYALTWTMIRYRVPVDVFLVIFAAYTVALLWDALRRDARSPLRGARWQLR